MCNKQVGAIHALPQPVVRMYVMCKRITIMLMTLTKYDTGKLMWANVGVRALSHSLLRSGSMYRGSTTFIIIFLLFFIAAF